MSGPSGRDPGQRISKLIRGGDLIRAMWKVPGKSRGLCQGCTWVPVGQTPHNISRELMRHTRRTGHVTRFATVEIVEYRKPAPSVRPEVP